MNADWILADWDAPSNVLAGTSTRNANLDELPGKPKWLKQVHGATVVRSDDPAFAVGPVEADGIISSSRNDMIAVRTADCLPVLLCSAAGDEIAAVHCGWRSLAADILAEAVAQMGTPAGQLLAWLGPAISQPAFEVQDDVRDAFVGADAAAAAHFTPNARGRWQADLYGLAAQKLAAAGISPISGGGFCTVGDPERFYSWRRDGETGRLVSFITLK